MIPVWFLRWQAWWKHPPPLIPHDPTKPSAFARNSLPTLSTLDNESIFQMHLSISYSMTTTTTTSVKIAFTMLLFTSLNSTSIVISYTWNVSMYFKKTLMFPYIKMWVLWRSKECEGKKMEFWEEGNVEESQDSSSITQCLLLRWCGWAGFAHALGKWKLWTAFTIFSRWHKGKVQGHELAGISLSQSSSCLERAGRAALRDPW